MIPVHAYPSPCTAPFGAISKTCTRTCTASPYLIVETLLDLRAGGRTFSWVRRVPVPARQPARKAPLRVRVQAATRTPVQPYRRSACLN